MMRHAQKYLPGILIIIMLALSSFACRSEAPPMSTEALVMHKTETFFTRIKVRDYAAIWENEFPYMREDSPLEDYLNNAYMKWYKPDTLVAIELDSATVWEDSAYVHMKTEWVLADSSLKVDTIRLRWNYRNGEWLKPTLSMLEQQFEFEEELRIYWEAVEAMQKKQQDQPADSAGGDGTGNE